MASVTPAAGESDPLSSKTPTSSPSHPGSSSSPSALRIGLSLDTSTVDGDTERQDAVMPSAAESSRRSASSAAGRSAEDIIAEVDDNVNPIVAANASPPAGGTAVTSGGPTRRTSESSLVPESAIGGRQAGSVGESDSNRMSFSSLYSLGQSIYNSARNTMAAGASQASSVAGSEVDGAPLRSDPIGVSGAGSASVSSHQDRSGTSPRVNKDPAALPLPSPALMGVSHSTQGHGASTHASTSPQSARGAPVASGPPPRSRSTQRTPRRVSGSAGAGSASPGSDRGRAVGEMKAPFGIIGVCALDSKARSKPSRNILNKLIAEGEFEVIIFGDKVILDEDVEDWPVCDFLISFFSTGFPLEKAIRYVELRKPFCVNDLPMQMVLWDRRLCLRILDSLRVPTPKRVEVNRDGGPTLPSAKLAKTLRERTGMKLLGPEDGTGGAIEPPKKVELMEDNNVLFVDGKTIRKPFVEKPVSGEDHNIRIYYHGGGGRRLFRKVNNKSSERDDSLDVPRCLTEPDNSYIYEQFLQAEGCEDVKAYTVGPDFCHAETRKSPVVDGLVRRNPNGKEVRYVTSLTKEEQAIAAKISEAFGQRVCGFDLLRANGGSYVIDVNGWSFVKDNNDYYDRCAGILRQIFIREKMKKEGVPLPVEVEEQSIGKERSHHRKATGGSASGSHRAAFKSIFKSPSMTKLTGHHHYPPGHPHGPEPTPPDASAPPSPVKATSSTERSPGIPPLGLPPPAPLPAMAGDAAKERSADAISTTPAEPVEPVEAPVPPPASKAQWKLKGLVSVVRHADRTPKQKFKFTFHTRPFVDLLKGHQEEVLYIGELALASVLEAVNKAFEEGLEDTAKLQLLKTSLVKKGRWPGTKVQIKPMFRQKKVVVDAAQTPLTGTSVEMLKNEAISDASTTEESGAPLHRSDSNVGVTFSRISAAENNMEFDKLQLVIKWGGEPTHSARYQAQDLGENLRNDLLLLNKHIFDDVSVFSSSERRVTTSAKIFSSAFLADETLPESFIDIRKDLLDDSNAAKDEMDKVKKKLKVLLREGDKAPEEFTWPENFAEPYVVVRHVIELMKFHRRVMRQNYTVLQSELTTTKSASTAGDTEATTGDVQRPTATSIQPRWCSGEDPSLFRERWEKLFAEFCDADKVDPSKISELYDTMKFDALHNRPFLEWAFRPSEAMLAEEISRGSAMGSTAGDTQPARTPDEPQAQQPQPEVRKRPTIPSRAPSESRVSKDSREKESPSSSTADRHNEKDPGKESSSSSTRSNLAHRLTFRRRAETAAPKTAPPNPESYFSLDRGSGDSRFKLDGRLVKLRELYRLCKVLFDYIGPQEYGMSNAEKLEIGLLTSLPLLKEIVLDLEEVQAADDPKSFFYFTKESHIYTLLNCIFEGGVPTKISRNAIPELDYLSQISFELYESQNASEGGEEGSFNYSIRVTISPGCHTFDPLDVHLDSKHCIGCAPRRSLTPHVEWKSVIESLRANFSKVKLPKSFVAINLAEKIPHAYGPPTESEAEEKERRAARKKKERAIESAKEQIPGTANGTADTSKGEVADV